VLGADEPHIFTAERHDLCYPNYDYNA
jgi:hypothetical protein